MHPRFLFIGAIVIFLSLFVLIELLSYDDITRFPRVFNLQGHYNAAGYPLQVAILVVATGKYIKFAEIFISSMRKYFDCPLCNVTYVVFTDSPLSRPAVDIMPIKYSLEPWPHGTLKRPHAFLQNRKELDQFDYLLAIDADMRVRSRVGMEILGDSMATLHPAFYHNKIKGPYENNTHSSAYISPSEGGHYFAGGFYGARSDFFWKMTQGIAQLVDTDLAHNYIAIWHDESYLNRYFATHPPTIILSPAYCSPERWSLPYESKIVARSKRHSVARS